ncbi:hypothetical protein BJ878DRAFT_178465 [Calycina marina]|uniref:Uncharacterized protein n=1 Tax=Calycina marina TaxID=1763456 RepID=A0A9P8CD74_9HELO|nr:hypothetical protein BJ878DRAFT_178465 [Calycina marina]
MRFSEYVPAVLAAASSFRQTLLGHTPSSVEQEWPGKKVDYYARNLKTVSSIYNLTVFPHNVPIIVNGSKAVPPGLFAPTATGRVSPLGNFTGFDDSIEYFFALALVPSAPAYAVFTSAKVIEFSCGCAEVASSVAYLETRVYAPGAPDHNKYLSTLKQVAFWKFDKHGAVLFYDAWIPNLDQWDFLALGHKNVSNPVIQSQIIRGVCSIVQQRCVGKDQQYESMDDCVANWSQKSFGTYAEVWGDNVVCRTIHVILTLVRPDAHCMHVGPTGGGKCVDWPYNNGYFDDNLLFGKPSGQTFICPEKEHCHWPLEGQDVRLELN